MSFKPVPDHLSVLRAWALRDGNLDQITEFFRRNPIAGLAQQATQDDQISGEAASPQPSNARLAKLQALRAARQDRTRKKQEEQREKREQQKPQKPQNKDKHEKPTPIQIIRESLRARREHQKALEEGVRPVDCADWIIEDNASREFGPKTSSSLQRFNSGGSDMAPPTLSRAQNQRRSVTQMSKILSLRNSSSPFTLVVDDLNQPSYPLISEFTRRGISRNINVVLVTFHTKEHLGNPAIVYIEAWNHDNKTPAQLLANLEAALEPFKESLVVIDSLADMVAQGVDMTTLFNLVAAKYRSNIVGVYHQDMLMNYYPFNPYCPQLLDELKYVATCILTCKSFAHVLAAKAAAERSLPEPTHGLLQSAEGIVQSLGANDSRGIVMEAEFRRKSGRPETEVFYLPAPKISDYHPPVKDMVIGVLKSEVVICLDMLELYTSKETMEKIYEADKDMSSTFNLDLTAKQKEAREGVVLPYFDAQTAQGGEGGRILYDMGEEDDFDEEEDEI